jgi:glycosyltransferase involved in cell wall biosynthesis
MRMLFVSWDGPGPNYHESLFLPIFARSRRPDDEIHLLQYAWDSDERNASVRSAAQRLGMPYTARPVWRTPQALATAAMIARGALDLVRYVRRHRIDVLMPRSIIPAGMALLALRVLPGVKLLFDADGLMADERADFGGWSREGKPYRALRAIEAAAVRRADGVITRTYRAKRILTERADLSDDEKIIVVSNGKDAEAFHPGTAAERSATRRELGLSDETPLLVYAGSLGPHYYPERMAAFAAVVQAKRPEAHLLILTGSLEVGQAACEAVGLDPSSYTVRRVPPDEVPRHLAAADLGIAFRTASLSQQAVAPIKVGEYLLCGLPVLSTSGIGDLDDQLDTTTGRLLENLDDTTLEESASWFVQEVLSARERYRASCRERGLEHFSLERSAAQYHEAFRILRQEQFGN